MKSTIFKSLFVLGLMCMFTLGVQAQDVPIKRPPTTTEPAKSKPTPTPKPKTPTTGTLSITSTPSGAVVKIDGKYMGETPLMLNNQKTGTHTITFSADGYDNEIRSVRVLSGKIVSCNVSLNKKEIKQTNISFSANGVNFTMIRVDGGTFTMGATPEQGSEAESDEKPTHNVTLSSYYIGETEVTQELWQAIMGSNPSNFKGLLRPVEMVNWHKCQEFINKLNELTGQQFRLPTEAEWEYAARGGNKTNGFKYSGSNMILNVAWCYDNSGYETHPVKKKSPNELGLYDMSGNVGEWCIDWFDAYSSNNQLDPLAANTGENRVCRGGCWYLPLRSCRTTARYKVSPDVLCNYIGFRLVL